MWFAWRPKNCSGWRMSRCASVTRLPWMHWPRAFAPTACRWTAGRVARATGTTNAWCGTRKAIASRSRRKNEGTMVLDRDPVAGGGARVVTTTGHGLGPGLAGDHGQREAVDALGVGGQRRRRGESHEAARGHRGGGYRWRGDHDYLRPQGCRRPLREVPVAAVDGHARSHDARSR